MIKKIEKTHVCVILKDFTKDLYHYPSSEWLNEVFSQLDIVLMCNQYITNAFTEILKVEMGSDEFYSEYPLGLFPKFLYEFDQDIIRDNTDMINEIIENIKPAEHKMKKIKLGKWDLLDLTKPYAKIIAILKFQNDPLVEQAEYGYFIGCLLKIKADEWFATRGKEAFIDPDWDILSKRVDSFRSGVYQTIAAKEAMEK